MINFKIFAIDNNGTHLISFPAEEFRPSLNACGLCILVPGEGQRSNSESALLTEWNRKSKDVSAESDGLPEVEYVDQFFDTLAEWNSFLEKHVPYFQEVQP